MANQLHIFSGAANPALAENIARDLGIEMGHAMVSTFPNGETRVRIEDNVRGADVYLVQPVCKPVNEHLMQLLIMIDAVRRASAERITAVIPYFGYARQEKKTAGREPISAKLMANLIRTAGVDRILTMDLHAAAIEGFFDIPVDHLRAESIMADAVKRMGLKDVVVGSPDAGGVARAERFRNRLGSEDLFVTFKRRDAPDSVTHLQLVGNVKGRVAVIVDDIISTGKSLILAGQALMESGAQEVHACVVHPDFTNDVAGLLDRSLFKSVLVTDTIPIRGQLSPDSRIRVCTTAPIFAETIRRIHSHESVSALFG